MDVRDTEPRILYVELPLRSLATYRAIHDDDDDDDGGDTYAVVLTVSVGIDGFIEKELGLTQKQYPKFMSVDEHDRMRVVIHDTTLEQVHDRLNDLNEWFATAVGRAAEARRVADLEDDRLEALKEAINQSLGKRADGS